MDQFGFIDSYPNDPNESLMPTPSKPELPYNDKTKSSESNLPAVMSCESDHAEKFVSQQSSSHVAFDTDVRTEAGSDPVDSGDKYEVGNVIQSSFSLDAKSPADISVGKTHSPENQQVLGTETNSTVTQDTPPEPNIPSSQNDPEPLHGSSDENDHNFNTNLQNPSENEQKSRQRTSGIAKYTRLSRKRRRRIVQLNDDSDDDNDLRKELEQEKSPVKETKDGGGSENDDSGPNSDSDEDITDIGVIKVRSLLKSAVIIQDPSSKRKKQRLLDSDDEEPQTLVDVDDIGLVDENENENDVENDDSYVNDIIVSEPLFEVGESEPVEEPEKIEESDAIAEKEDFSVPDIPEQAGNNPYFPDTEEKIKNHKSPPSIEDNREEGKKEEKPAQDDGGNKSSAEQSHEAIDPNLPIEEALEKIKPMDDNDEFFTFDRKSDHSDDQFVSNEDYFGTPDMNKPRPRQRPTSAGRRTTIQKLENSSRRKRSNKYKKDTFIDDSNSESDTSFSLSSESSEEETRPKPRPAVVRKPPVISGLKSFTVTRVSVNPIKKKKADRFYDKSRDIPNDVYFGDVKVPLHVLHSRWDSHSNSDNSEPESRVQVPKPIPIRLTSIPHSKKQSFNSRLKPQSFNDFEDDPKLSTFKDFAKVCGIKINYTKLFNGVRSTDDKCMLIRRILAQKGLKGEPTLTKCRQLKLDLQAKRESAELDKSAIITSEGRRTRRSARSEAGSSAVIQPETLQTLSKIRRVVDSDSE